MRRFLEVVLPWITSANVFWWFCCGVLLVCFILLGFILGGGGFISEPSLPPPFPPHNRLMSLLPLLHLTSTSTPKGPGMEGSHVQLLSSSIWVPQLRHPMNASIS